MLQVLDTSLRRTDTVHRFHWNKMLLDIISGKLEIFQNRARKKAESESKNKYGKDDDQEEKKRL